MGENRYRLQPAVSGDRDFLYRVYASTRELEMAITGWDSEETEHFLRFQFELQQTQFWQNYPDASFDIIYLGDRRAGRLYINRSKDEIRIIDITLLPEFRRRGTGTRILRDIIAEAEAAGLSLRLHVAHNNPALSLYTQLGFTGIGDTGVYYFLERLAPAATPGAGRKDRQ